MKQKFNVRPHPQRPSITVTVTDEADVANEWVQSFAGWDVTSGKQQRIMLGIDIKRQPIRARGREGDMALIQLCNSSHCLILQMLYLDRMPEEIAELLDCPDVPLGGCGIEHVGGILEADYGMPCNGLVDLGQLASKVFHNKRWRQADLDEMQFQLVGQPVMKPRRVAQGDWSRQGLGWNQIQLAVLDAWMAYSVFTELAVASRVRAKMGVF